MNAVVVKEPRDYLEAVMGKTRKGDRLVVILDPERYLDLEDELALGGRAWQVFHYAGNDLAFRAIYGHGPTDPNLRHVVWVTPAPYRREPAATLNLSFIPDVLRRADRIVDLSLEGLLRALIPGEVFPRAALQEHRAILCGHLDTLVSGHAELRVRLGEKQALDTHHVRALALHCQQPDILIPELLFIETSARELLIHYLRLVWSGRGPERALPLLQEHAAQSPPLSYADLQPWFQSPPEELALLVYLYRVLRGYRVANPLNQLRGLGLLAMDPAPLAAYLDTAAALWDDPALHSGLLQRAESRLDGARIGDLVELLPLTDMETVAQALRRETAPALVYGLGERYLTLALRTGALADTTREIETFSTPAGARTAFSAPAQALLATIRDVASVRRIVERPLSAASGLAPLVDWYVTSGAWLLELACARAEEGAQKLSADIRGSILSYLEQLRRQVWNYLDQADSRLADEVAESYPAFLGHPRCSIRVLHDTVLHADWRPSPEQALWVLVFDGMRWDTWQEVVRPALTEYLEVIDEGKAYLCLLPSFTAIARTGLLAGGAPATWLGANGRPTTNEVLLASHLFDLEPAERDRRLRFEVAREGSAGQQRLGGDFDRRAINILVYNISDDWIHQFQGSLAAANDVIAAQVQRVAEELRCSVREGDRVVVTSDHGFIELDPAAGIPIGIDAPAMPAPAEQSTFYRYLENVAHLAGLQVPVRGDDFYTVARGRSWFQRAGGRGTRYAHGGISLGEMVVPGVVLQRIVKPVVQLELTGLPRQIAAREKDPQTIQMTVRNAGNREASYSLLVAADTEREGQTFRGVLRPRESQEWAYTFTPRYSPRKTQSVTVQGTYRDVDGQEKRLPARVVVVETAPRQDVVEIGFAGLDQLDDS